MRSFLIAQSSRLFFFFFQAEDGIRDGHVTGVQTCALPILLESDGNGPFSCQASVCNEGRKTWDEEHKRVEFGSGPTVIRVSTVNGPVSVRSEERRVGKECRARVSPYH